MSDEIEELKIPFLNNSEEYVLGFEMGVIFAQMQIMRVETIEAIIGSMNEEQLQVIAKSLGYEVLSMEDNGAGTTRVQIYLRDHSKIN